MPPEDPGAIARALLELKEDNPLRENFGKKGREYALRYHSPQAAAEKFEQLLLAALPVADPVAFSTLMKSSG